MSLFQELQWRNLIKDCNDEKELKNLLDKSKIFFYCGFDPTANSLTIGHLVQIITISLLKKRGHNPFILIGTATSLIGDPKENKERKLLDIENIPENVRKIKKQLKKLLFLQENSFLSNLDWISKIDLVTFFRNYGKFFNVNYMISKEIISKRLETGISYAEFSYMILQALDFYKLYKEKNVQLQIGGSDQWGNIMSGLELIRKKNYLDKKDKKAFGMTIPLLLDNKGVKFGKSENNNLWLDPNLTEPYLIYQYFFNTKDDKVIHYLKTLTLLERTNIENLEKIVLEFPKQRLAQKELAKFVILFLFGEKVLKRCLKIQEILFIYNKDNIKLKDFILLKKHLNSVKISKVISLLEALVKTKLATSKKEARRLVEARSIKVFNQVIDQIDYLLNKTQTLYDKYILLTKKNKFKALVFFD